MRIAREEDNQGFTGLVTARKESVEGQGTSFAITGSTQSGQSFEGSGDIDHTTLPNGTSTDTRNRPGGGASRAIQLASSDRDRDARCRWRVFRWISDPIVSMAIRGGFHAVGSFFHWCRVVAVASRAFQQNPAVSDPVP